MWEQAGGGIISGAAGLIGGWMTNKANERMQRNQQKWQTSEREASQVYNTSEREASQRYNTSERLASQQYQTSERTAQNDWQEYMYNQYNSPAAMAQQLKDAGLNPRLAGNSGVGGIAASSGSSGGAPSGSAPSGSHVSPGSVSPPYMSGGGYTEGFANMANALKSIADAKKAGVDTKKIEQEIANMKVSEEYQKFLLSIDKQFLKKERLKALEKLGVEIETGVATIDTIRQTFENLKKDGAMKDKDLEKYEERFIAEITELRTRSGLNEANTASAKSDIAVKSSQAALNRAHALLAGKQGELIDTEIDLNKTYKKIQDNNLNIQTATMDSQKDAMIQSNLKTAEKLDAEIELLIQKAREAQKNADYALYDRIIATISATASLVAACDDPSQRFVKSVKNRLSKNKNVVGDKVDFGTPPPNQYY